MTVELLGPRQRGASGCGNSMSQQHHHHNVYRTLEGNSPPRPMRPQRDHSYLLLIVSCSERGTMATLGCLVPRPEREPDPFSRCQDICRAHGSKARLENRTRTRKNNSNFRPVNRQCTATGLPGQGTLLLIKVSSHLLALRLCLTPSLVLISAPYHLSPYHLFRFAFRTKWPLMDLAPHQKILMMLSTSIAVPVVQSAVIWTVCMNNVLRRLWTIRVTPSLKDSGVR